MSKQSSQIEALMNPHSYMPVDVDAKHEQLRAAFYPWIINQYPGAQCIGDVVTEMTTYDNAPLSVSTGKNILDSVFGPEEVSETAGMTSAQLLERAAATLAARRRESEPV